MTPMILDAGTYASGTQSLMLLAVIGFLAQIVDGAIGMAYKATASSLLLGLGMPPASVSATVHTASAFTGAVSGLSHWRLGNVDNQLLVRLAIPGMIGGILGSMVLTWMPADAIRPWISIYLLLLGSYILCKAIRGGFRRRAGRRRAAGVYRRASRRYRRRRLGSDRYNDAGRPRPFTAHCGGIRQRCRVLRHSHNCRHPAFCNQCRDVVGRRRTGCWWCRGGPVRGPRHQAPAGAGADGDRRHRHHGAVPSHVRLVGHLMSPGNA